MTLVLQPPRSKLCGHACVAMAAGLTLDQVIREIGHRQGTTTIELARILNRHGFQVRNRVTSLYPGEAAPNRALLKLQAPRWRNWHWVLLWDGVLYDPAGTSARYPSGRRYTSYLDLTRRADETIP